MGRLRRITIQEASKRLSRYRAEKRINLDTGDSWMRARSFERKKLAKAVIKWLYIRRVKKVSRIIERIFWDKTSPKPGMPEK
jgi:hypothetical protein